METSLVTLGSLWLTEIWQMELEDETGSLGPGAGWG